jgi:hypothetical protein
MGDPILGAEAPARFLPMRFTAAGDAVDPLGVVCPETACPSCHLELPRACLEMPPCLISIAGEQASGKSYYLGAMISELRRILPRFRLAIADADAGANRELHAYEDTVFRAADLDTPVAIRKTEQAGDALYRTVYREGELQLLPRPFLFTVSAGADHPLRADERFPFRTLGWYDNAGEHYRPGIDQRSLPVTQHLARAKAVQFLFDPTRETALRRHLDLGPDQPDPRRQDLILNEIISRIRRYRGMGQTARHQRPLMMVLSKADLWGAAVGWSPSDSEPLVEDPELGLVRLDRARIQAVSDRCRELLNRHLPDLVAVAESAFETVHYLPVSSLGTPPALIDGRSVVRPRDVRPAWVTVPTLLALAEESPRLIPVQ